MAVDFSLLPVEISDTNKPPSRFVWTVVFLVLVLVGIFSVLMLWPKSKSTHTFDFWCTLVLFPVGIPALIVLLRYQHHAARELDVQMSNRATRQYNDRVFSAASEPISVLGVSHRFSAMPDENAITSIQSGALRLTVQELFACDSEPDKVRWLEVPDVKLHAGTHEDDQKRHIEVTRWLFKELLAELAGAINALPMQAGLDVHLLVSGMLTGEQNEALWRECWDSFGFHIAYAFAVGTDRCDLQMVDGWLDQVASGRQREVKLVVAIQLHSLLADSPPRGTAEAGVGLLLIPYALARQHGMARMTNLYRPVRGPFNLSNGALMHALKWASSTAKAISGGWQTGLDQTHAGALRKSAVLAGLEILPVDLDSRVGHAGIAAPWLAVACAANSLSTAAPLQIVFAGQCEGVDCAVLSDISVEDRSMAASTGLSEKTTEPQAT
ncbi:hypothetical protein [Paraburkholderia tagetis]|uniref:Uncharacterized protein n=1 Tax=Paraburkholderia tagetis TaxID=2913261 RepID=A0A9X1RPY5_9BURK|nr:hypothetical protein [Paraburkholderia tagetis]MCG5076156.1 hypothetical protein [Paraburkholderia tagetis]